MITKYRNKSGKRSICVCEYCKCEFETLDIKIREGKEKYCSKDCYNNFRCENKKDTKERNILYQKKSKYGLSEKDYKNMFIKQNNKCAICDISFDIRKAFVDHSHDSGKVRGLLCTKCNSILGMSNDSIVILNKAIKYLENNN